MPIKTVIFLIAFAAACGGALYMPLIGILGYVLHYQVGPEQQWWAESISHWGLRYSLAIAVFTGAGIFINRRRLRYGDRLLSGHEWLMILFVVLTWLSLLHGLPPAGPIVPSDYQPYKIAKVMVFCLMLTHVVTTQRELGMLFWAIVAGVAFLGVQAYTAPDWMFTTGRLNSIGGPDFREANFLGAYIVIALPIVGMQFMRSGWVGKAACAVSGALGVNALVLARSRGAFVAVAATTVFALLIAPKKNRAYVYLATAVAVVGAYSLTDEAFWERTSTITATEDERDQSAQSRIDIWKASLDMLSDYPLGVGAGNFQDTIGKYLPKYPIADAHSTYVRCYGELGIPGIILLAVLVGSAARILWRTGKALEQLPPDRQRDLRLMRFGLSASLVASVCGGLTMTLLWVEATWWLLAMPVCLWRAVANAKTEAVGDQPRPASLQTGAHHGT